MTTRAPWRPRAGDLSGAVADLGVLVPLVAALVLVNGLDPGPVLLVAGGLSLAAGLWFGVPFPVQPLKALTALAVAQRLDPELVHAGGLLIGLVLLALAVTGLADRIAAAFTAPVIRSLQLAVGTLLVLTAVDLAVEPPAVLARGPGTAGSLGLGLLTLALVAVAAWRRWYLAAVVVLLVGVTVAVLAGDPQLGAPSLRLPSLGVPDPAVWPTAFVLLVIPQLPLTYGNAVVGVADLVREEFPQARRVTPGAVALSCALGNLVAAVAGGMPMCHGSSGFSAHVRLGARTAAMNVLLGGGLLLLGLAFSGQVLELFGLLPAWALAGFLAYAGLRHALLVLDLRGHRLGWAVAAGAVGVGTGNLAYTTALALAVEWLPRAWRRHRAGPRRAGHGDGEPDAP